MIFIIITGTSGYSEQLYVVRAHDETDAKLRMLEHSVKADKAIDPIRHIEPIDKDGIGLLGVLYERYIGE
jgi:hypothetical protein